MTSINVFKLDFKACVHYFFLTFIFPLNDSASRTTKNVFLFHLKISFHSRDIQNFVIFSLPFQTFQTKKDK